MDAELKDAVVKALTDVSPEIRPEDIEPDVNFRDQFDFDSMDFLNFAMRLSETTGIDIPETDLPLLTSLKSCIEYLSTREAKASQSAPALDRPAAK